ncbi:MAG TPA: SDR family oxidoreductase [Acidimicrobiales bacterium]|nr:SDR family oxidoreductase [Acidimicrobiales bacterium]
MTNSTRTALITGASRGLGLALARDLAADGWSLVLDARGAGALRAVADELGSSTSVVAIAGDVADEAHRLALADAARRAGGIDALVHNASDLGPTPLPRLAGYPLDDLGRVYEVNVLAPLRLTQLLLPRLRPGGRVLAVTSDAAVEAYAGWGGYGSSKAALEALFAVLAVEEPALRVYSVDPGDMNTRMQQVAFPGEDVSDRPPPEQSVPGLRVLLDGELPSGRYAARTLSPPVAVAT